MIKHILSKIDEQLDKQRILYLETSLFEIEISYNLMCVVNSILRICIIIEAGLLGYQLGLASI